MFNDLKKDYLASIVLSIGFIIFFIYILNIYEYIPNQDIWRYTEWAVDIVKYQPNILQNADHFEWYLGSIYYTSFYNFFLSSMILGDVESWDLIIKFIIPIMTIILLIFLILDFVNKINKKINYLPIILLSSSFYLLNWFFYSLPTTIAIILGILSIKTLFDKEKRSYLMFGVCIIFQYLFHTPTTLVFLIGIVIAIIILFLIKISSKGLRFILIGKIKEKFYIYLLIIICISIIIIGGAIIFFTPILFSPTYFERFLDLYTDLQSKLIDYEIRSQPPELIYWIKDLIGPHILLISLISFIFIVRKFKKVGKDFKNSTNLQGSLNEKVKLQDTQLNILAFFWVLQIVAILICVLLPIWYWISTFTYLYYRYFIYIELTCLFLAVFSFSEIAKYLSHKKYRKKKNTKKYVRIFQISFIGLTLYFTSFHFFIRDYNLYKHYEYIPEGNLNIYYWLRDNTEKESIYLASPYSECGQIYYHPIMNDRKFLDPVYQVRTFDDPKYYSVEGLGYHRFLHYLHLEKKLLNLRFANINNSDKSTIYTNDNVDYIILDDYHNPNLVQLMCEDNEAFILLKNETNTLPFTSEKYNVYLFYYKNFFNYFRNSKFEFDYTEWFLIKDIIWKKYIATLNRSDFDPYEGNYSLIFNKTRERAWAYFKSESIKLSTQFNYSFSCYFKYIRHLGTPPFVNIKFFINYLDSNNDLISKENIYILYGYNNSETYSFLNFTFPIIAGSNRIEIEIGLHTNPQRIAILSLDNICLKKVD